MDSPYLTIQSSRIDLFGPGSNGDIVMVTSESRLSNGRNDSFESAQSRSHQYPQREGKPGGNRVKCRTVRGLGGNSPAMTFKEDHTFTKFPGFIIHTLDSLHQVPNCDHFRVERGSRTVDRMGKPFRVLYWWFICSNPQTKLLRRSSPVSATFHRMTTTMPPNTATTTTTTPTTTTPATADCGAGLLTSIDEEVGDIGRGQFPVDMHRFRVCFSLPVEDDAGSWPAGTEWLSDRGPEATNETQATQSQSPVLGAASPPTVSTRRREVNICFASKHFDAVQ
ncbi:unnamed protein product, partial [Protopolystoma xenopodis]